MILLQGTVSSGGGGEWNGLPYQSISLNQGMEDEVEYVNKESIIPDQMIGEEVYDEMNGSTADEPCVESINSSQEEEGDGEGIIVSYNLSHSSCLMVCAVEYYCTLCMYHVLQVVVYWMRSMFRD